MSYQQKLTPLWHGYSLRMMFRLYGRSSFTHKYLTLVIPRETECNKIAKKWKIYCKYNSIKGEIVINCNNSVSESKNNNSHEF